ncbi:hypothetical protein LCGC14_2840980 [marine sediment metagenome]|uniref:Uncharacterized protein n=1 Tax=marine sediment metagenome TaxID=412755 RepID=A0A0F8YXW1_9ZZZZ
MEKTYLTTKEFEDLLEYSCSIPTGTTLGKKWKRHIYCFRLEGRTLYGWAHPPGATIISDEWHQGEYVKSEKPGFVDIRWTEIIVAGPMEIDKAIIKFEDRGRRE